MQGTVMRAQSGFFWIKLDIDGSVLRCILRGRLKKEPNTGNLATIGDRVIVTATVAGEGVIESIDPRHSKLSRRTPERQGRWREDVIVANLDLLLATFAVAQPEPHPRMIDRFLVIAEANAVTAAIVVNKCDLRPIEEAKTIFEPYARIGYPIFYVSTKTGMGIDLLREALRDKLAAFSGPSGVGKSSLLNALQPGLSLRTGAVSGAVNKGQHTTVAPELHRLDGGGYLADTPGIRELALWRIPAEEIERYFREFQPVLGQCEFGDCAHNPQRGCAIRAAVERGEISVERYESYLKLREQVAAEVVR